jgi:ABC-type microcin C transport system permease subunit YejB
MVVLIFEMVIPPFVTTYALKISSLSACYFTALPLHIHCTHIFDLSFHQIEMNWKLTDYFKSLIIPVIECTY